MFDKLAVIFATQGLVQGVIAAVMNLNEIINVVLHQKYATLHNPVFCE